jgi:plastocyanin
LLAAFAVVAVLFAGACSKSDKSTNPAPGGAKELDSPNIAGGGTTFSHTFPATLTSYPYHCKIHSGMHGSVMVSSGGPANAAVTISGNAFSPSPVTVGPSGTVTWTNNDATNHTVTSD